MAEGKCPRCGREHCVRVCGGQGIYYECWNCGNRFTGFEALKRAHNRELVEAAKRTIEALTAELSACHAREAAVLDAYEMPSGGTSAIFRRRAWEAIMEAARTRRAAGAEGVEVER